MAATVTADPSTGRAVRPAGLRTRHIRGRLNWSGALGGWVWLLIVLVPIYWIVITSLKSADNYYDINVMVPPSHPSLQAYHDVFAADFAHYFLNSAVVTVFTTAPAVIFSFMAAYAVVRGGASRFLRGTNVLFLTGLAIPLQAVVIPIYLIIIKLRMYDTLTAIVLPSIAFAIPLSVLVLANFVRDVPKELFESMTLDGASEWRTLWSLAFPLTRPALVTVGIYQGLTAWNGFILPLILTTNPDRRTLPLALWQFQSQFGVNVPAVMASVVLSTLPILVLYVVGRRQLLAGLTAGFSK